MAFDPSPMMWRNLTRFRHIGRATSLQKYQGSIETLRLEVFDFLSQENLDLSKFVCDWARKIIGRARRGVVCKEGEQRDDAAAATQGHSANTERAKYRAM